MSKPQKMSLSLVDHYLASAAIALVLKGEPLNFVEHQALERAGRLLQAVETQQLRLEAVPSAMANAYVKIVVTALTEDLTDNDAALVGTYHCRVRHTPADGKAVICETALDLFHETYGIDEVDDLEIATNVLLNGSDLTNDLGEVQAVDAATHSRAVPVTLFIAGSAADLEVDAEAWCAQASADQLQELVDEQFSGALAIAALHWMAQWRGDLAKLISASMTTFRDIEAKFDPFYTTAWLRTQPNETVRMALRLPPESTPAV